VHTPLLTERRAIVSVGHTYLSLNADVMLANVEIVCMPWLSIVSIIQRMIKEGGGVADTDSITYTAMRGGGGGGDGGGGARE